MVHVDSFARISVKRFYDYFEWVETDFRARRKAIATLLRSAFFGNVLRLRSAMLPFVHYQNVSLYSRNSMPTSEFDGKI